VRLKAKGLRKNRKPFLFGKKRTHRLYKKTIEIIRKMIYYGFKGKE